MAIAEQDNPKGQEPTVASETTLGKNTLKGLEQTMAREAILSPCVKKLNTVLGFL